MLWTLPFWVLLGALCLVLIATVEYERPGLAMLSLILTGLLLWLFGNVNVFALATVHPGLTLLWIAGYFVIGALWSVSKWWFFVSARRREYNEKKAGFLKSHGLPENWPVPDTLRLEWLGTFTQFSLLSLKDSAYLAHEINNKLKPRVHCHKQRILTWMAYWPWSMTWTLLNDPVERLFRYIYTKMLVLFQKIADHAFRGVENDFALPGAPPLPTPNTKIRPPKPWPDPPPNDVEGRNE